MALALQAFSHSRQRFFCGSVRQRQLFASMARVFGTAWGKREKIALRWPSCWSNSLGTFLGHFASQSPHPVHFVGSTYRGAILTLTVKSPAWPETDVTSASVWILMLRCRPTSTILGEIMHMAQSPVGKVLSSITMVPPTEVSFWTICTLKPLSARSSAACMPPMPPPTIRTEPRLFEDFCALISGSTPLTVPWRPRNDGPPASQRGRSPWRRR